MPKVRINQLRNLVLEGGGAKGVTYVGAIIGIEKALAEQYKFDPLNRQPNAKAILDYGKADGDKFVPQVDHFAGSSAGAITSFALALGLHSGQIQKAAEYPFKNFLQDTDPGKYRMIGKGNQACIGEDKRSFLGRGDGKEDYAFPLDKRQAIKPSFMKAQIRKQVLDAITKTLIAGIYDTLEDYLKMVYKADDAIKTKGQSILDALPIDMGGLTVYGVKALGNFLHGRGANTNNPSPRVRKNGDAGGPAFNKSALYKMFWSAGLNWFIKRKFQSLSKHSSMNLGMEAIGNLFWDRGMFSGFAVREFFFDMMVYACLNDTHFQRCYFPNEDDRKKLLQIKMEIEGGRLEADFSALDSGLIRRLRLLPKLTFKEFADLTGISLTLCVSNYSTGEPVYFSEYWSPDFPVMEAVGASMSIPPAIKPVYNEGNAISQGAEIEESYQLDPRTLGKSGQASDYFDFDRFQVDLVAIKQFLATLFNINIHHNNPLSVSGHLTLLRRCLLSPKYGPGFKERILVDGEEVALSYELMVYHYNTAFKGLLFDGGYRCNIPYNVFRTSMAADDGGEFQIDVHLQHTLAIKLDDTFPKEWIHKIYTVLADPIKKMGSPKFLRKEQRTVLGQILQLNFKTLFAKVNARAQGRLFENEDISKLNKESFERIAETVVNLYEDMRTRHRTPWNKDKSIVMAAMEGYEYGSEAGQIRFLSDHQNIVPLFSYGLGCYDFELDKVRPLADIAKIKAEKRLDDYFAP